MKAFNERDATLGGSLYSEKSVMMPPNAAAIQGREKIAATFVDPASAGLSLELRHTEAVTSGDLGYVQGVYTTKAADGTVVDDGKYLEIRRRVNGAWLIDRDIYNSNRPAPTVPDAGATKAIADQYVSVWNTGNLAVLDTIIAPHAKRITPGDESNANGPTEFKAVVQGFRAAYPDAKLSVTSLDAFPGGGTVHWRFVGTNTGPGGAAGVVEPTGKRVDLRGLTTFRIADGKMVEERVAFDRLAWLQQLGFKVNTP